MVYMVEAVSAASVMAVTEVTEVLPVWRARKVRTPTWPVRIWPEVQEYWGRLVVLTLLV